MSTLAMHDASSATPAVPGPSAVATSLLATLREEDGALSQLSTLFELQFQAVRTRQSNTLDEITYRVTEQLSTIDRLRHQRDRQVRLLGRVVGVSAVSIAPMAEKLSEASTTAPLGRELMETRDRVMARAQQTQKQGQVLAFALQYAASLSREMMQAVQGVQAPAGSNVYTAMGAKANTTPRAGYVNQMG